MSGSKQAGEGPRPLIQRIVGTDQRDLTGSAHLGPKAIAAAKASCRQGFHRYRDLILGAQPGVPATTSYLYFVRHE